MLFYIFLLLITPKICYAYHKWPSAYGPKIVSAQIRSSHMKLLLEEEDKSGMDIMSTQVTKPGKEWNVTFLAWPDTMEMLKKNKIRHRILVQHYKPSQDRYLERNRAKFGLLRNAITFESFMSLHDIEDFLQKALPKMSNGFKEITTVSIGKTVENRDIWMVKIVHKQAQEILFFDAGNHAREWLAIMTCMDLISEVAKAPPKSVISDFNWYIIPVLNPDGYNHTQSSGEYRMRRKNVNQKGCPEDCSNCGTDLNKNFGYKWGVSETSKNPCSEIYGGSSAFSEPESRALRDTLQKYKKNIILYLSFHSYGNVFLYPWGYAAERVEDWKDLHNVATAAARAIEKASTVGTKYTVGNMGSTFQPSSGSSNDYAKSIGIKYVFIMDVQESGPNGFDPDPSEIKTYVTENVAGIMAMAETIKLSRTKKTDSRRELDDNDERNATKSDERAGTTSMTISNMCHVIAFLYIFVNIY